MARKRTAVLISGRGSNLQALLDAAQKPDYPAEVVLVLSNVAEVQGLDRARAAGVETTRLSHRDFSSRQEFEAALDSLLREKDIELVALAGFMRVLTEGFIEKWQGRLINIHPSLLPSFPGLHTHERALESGVKLHGCSVHFVSAEVDGGALIGQAAVPVLAEDDAASLAGRVLEAEHRLYPRCLGLVASGQVWLEDGRCSVSRDMESTDSAAYLINPR